VLQTPQPPPEPAPQARPSLWRRLAHRLDKIFMATVLIPTLLAGVYYGVIASDVYISESRFVVRNPQRQTQGTIGALLQSTGFTRSQDDTYSVHDYVLSRDALNVLDEQLQLRKALSSADIDVFNRFPGLSWDDSFEAFYKHYRRYVQVEYDTVSSITTLYVRAYTAKEGRDVNDLLLQMSERLVNNLNIRSRQDLIQVAEKEVAVAEERAKLAAAGLSGFRTRQDVFDPDRQSALQLQGVAKVREELISAEAQLSQLRKISPDNPQIPSLVDRIGSLKKAIAAESSKVTGGSGSFTNKAAGFDRFVLEKAFADRQLATALSSLETARNEAQRKQLYLERLVQPNLPDKALEPRRFRSVLMVFVLGLILWGVISLIVASVKEHTA
jgi:capsular polysaccharide transport system permease protein